MAQNYQFFEKIILKNFRR